MKLCRKNYGFFGTLLMMICLWGGAFSSYAEENCGVLDYVEGESVGGWTWNSADPAAAMEVTVKVTNEATGETLAQFTDTADSYREDLKGKGIGTGNYGFEVTIPWSAYGDGTYVVEAYAGDRKLSGSKVHPIGEAALAAASDGSNAAVSEPPMRSLGIFRTTAYCPCYQCSEGWGRHTSTGAIASSGHTIAVDPRVIPYGSRVMINGVIYTAEDCGGAVKQNHIDIFFDTHGETLAHGSRKAEVFLLQ